MKNPISIKVEKKDLMKLMTTGVRLFLEEKPEFNTTNLTQKFMLKRAIDFYCKE